MLLNNTLRSIILNTDPWETIPLRRKEIDSDSLNSLVEMGLFTISVSSGDYVDITKTAAGRVVQDLLTEIQSRASIPPHQGSAASDNSGKDDEREILEDDSDNYGDPEGFLNAMDQEYKLDENQGQQADQKSDHKSETTGKTLESALSVIDATLLLGSALGAGVSFIKMMVDPQEDSPVKPR